LSRTRESFGVGSIFAVNRIQVKTYDLIDGWRNCPNLYISLQHACPVPVKSGSDGRPRRFTEVVLNEQWINGFDTTIMHAIIWPSAV
jgi:hypothetical protein